MKQLPFRLLLTALTTVALVCLAPAKASAEPSGEEIAEQSLDAFYYAADDMRVRVSMTLVNSEGKRRSRELTMLRKDMGASGDQRYYVYFHTPADVKGMTFLVWKEAAKEDDRWVFIPSIKLVRRIAADDKRSSFVGSDFTYEDVSGREVGDENHELLRSEELKGRPCYVLESRPRFSSDYARRVSWIDADRRLPLREEYFDARGEMVREFQASEVKQVGGVWTATKRTMVNHQTGHRTEVVFSDIAYDLGLDENLFTERYLRQPPRQWIR